MADKMTQDQHTKCSCSHSRHHQGRRKRHHSPKSPKEEEPKARDAPVDKPEAEEPEDKPWSQWIAGDNGRWFYRGRQKPGGNWEYQFVDGYSTPGQSNLPYVSQAVAYSGAGVSAQARTSSSTLSLYSVGYPAGQGVGPGELSQNPCAGGEDKTPSPEEPETMAKAHEGDRKGKNPEKVPDKKSKKRAAHAKKISTVVNSEKGKKFNPSLKVRGWLKDVEPDDE